MAITVKHTKVSTIPDGDDSSLIRPSDWNADHSLDGLGTMAEQDANNVTITGGSISGVSVSGYIPTSAEGVANGVATLDSNGQVPLSQIPPLGDLNYQGTWNASLNVPILVSSVGVKGYYYVVNVAGSTNLNGITDWQVGDWAVFDGTVWEKIDNTDAVTSVNGQTGTVVLTYSDVGAFPSTPTTGTGNVVLATNPTISSPNIDVIDFDQTYATTLTAGQLGWDGNNTLALGMAGGNVIQHIGEDSFFYIKASSAITKGQLIMFTGAVGASGVLTGAPSTGVTNPQYIMGVAAENIALNGFGLVQWFGEIAGLNTNAFNEGDVLYYDSAVTGGLTNIYPTSGIIVTVAAVAKKSSGGGVLYVRLSVTDRITASTGISISQATTGVTVTNTAPDQTVTLTAGTGISTSGTYPNFTVTNTAPDQTVVMNSGTGISVTGTYPNFTVTNTSPSSGGTVTSITAGTGLTGGTITSSGTIAIDSTVATLTGSQILTNKTISGSSNTLTNIGNSSLTNSSITINGSAISLGGSVSVGTVTSVTGTAPVVSSGGATPAISMAQATGSVNGYLSSTDWTTFNNKAPSITYTTNYIPYGQGTTTPTQSSDLTYDPSLKNLTAPQVRASNGIVVNSKTVSANFTIASGDSAMSAGPITVASGITVTVASGSRWVVL